MAAASEKKDDGLDLSTIDGEQLVGLAQVAETAERFPDMCRYMKRSVENAFNDGKDLKMEDRNLLSVAYKNVVGQLRQSWRYSQATQFAKLDTDVHDGYKKLIEKELEAVCMEVINLLQHDKGPVKKAQELEDKTKGAEDNAEVSNYEDTVFYLKMMGDYYRYLAEFKNDDESKNKTKEFYLLAMKFAKKKLPETHPTRLGLALNFSVAYYEILKNSDEACKLAKEAFDAAIEKLDTLNDASYKDSTLIMQLLRDNLTLWTSDKDQEAEQQ